MKKHIVIFALFCVSCVPIDTAKTLKHADGTNVDLSKVNFAELRNTKQGSACVWNLAYAIPLYGDDTVMKAAQNGNISNIELTARTGLWTFPINKSCLVVYGDSNNKWKK